MKFSSHPLLLFFLLSLAAYLLAPLWFPLAPYAGQHPLPDIRTFTPSLAAGLLYGLWFLLLYGIYGLAALRLRRLPQLPGLAWLLGTAFFLGIPQLFAFPINATDLYRYFIRGRIFSVYGQNPYVVEAASLTGDPFWRFAGEWATATSPYGPLWELTAGGVTGLLGLVAQGGGHFVMGAAGFQTAGIIDPPGQWSADLAYFGGGHSPTAGHYDAALVVESGPV